MHTFVIVHKKTTRGGVWYEALTHVKELADAYVALGQTIAANPETTPTDFFIISLPPIRKSGSAR